MPGDTGTPEATKRLHVFDAWNRLVKVQTDAETPVTVAEYRYDVTNRRIRKFTDPDGSNWTVREYYYNTQWQNLEVDKGVETRSGDPLSEPAVATGLYEQYVWSPRYVDAPILRDRDGDSNATTGDYGGDGNSENGVTGLEERCYYATDGNGNVTALADASGSVLERYVYDPYGKTTIYDDDWSDTVSWANSHQNEILYCGYRFDPETGLYHVRNRMYHPTLGRWLQRDPKGYVDGMSLYEYVSSRPITLTDPSGLGIPDDSLERTALDVAHAVAQFARDYGGIGGPPLPGTISTSEVGAYVEGELNRYETNRSPAGGDFDPVAAAVRAVASKASETIRDNIPVVGPLAKAAGGVEINDQQYPVVQRDMTKQEKVVEVVKAAAELVAIVVAAKVIPAESGLPKDSLKKPVSMPPGVPPRPTAAEGAKSGEPSPLARGKRAHAEEPVRPGEVAEHPTPSGKRMDRYDPETGHIREIKPDNPRAIRQGEKQVQGYKQEMERETGREHTTEVSPYDPKKYE